ncbi:threonine ammonia-lyase [Paramylibacter kogurei]|uniref:threonine ammonia-lyase n=1 Tax=Paramylibacter kogurei TaxID=1889778 RepID=UPI001F0A2DA6|nr:pyridoxal-phosphate dependent enzyme [Amylibacter kogurei]
MTQIPTIDLPQIKAAQKTLAGQIIKTPIVDLNQPQMVDALPDGCRATLKLELFQMAGSFKARGVYLSVQNLTPDQRKSGVVAASGGNHALAVSWAANAAGISAKIAIPRHADAIRIDGCRALGADAILCEDIAHAFQTMQDIAANENRAILHPFEGLSMSLGSATLGAEFHAQSDDLDIAIFPVGGGGLISGASVALKLLNPNIEIYGIEPFGADTMYRSFASGKPEQISSVDTIADSLGSPTALPISFGLTQQNVTAIHRVHDDEMRRAMALMNQSLNLMPEPACAAALAGLIGPLREICAGKRVGILACGANISLEKFQTILG